MQRLNLLATRLTLSLVLTLGTGLGNALATDPPGEPVRVTNYGEKAPVTFDHAKHGEVACVQCHHNQDDGQYKCGQCHGEAATEEAPKLKDAMHEKEDGKCYGCHFGPEPQAKKLKCAECHVKR
ncbi:MAG: cytochrome c3 family protein [Deferrisomatales bacterium]|nr:cytochrome c3 family protein [Deferrisomatales bacterium]